MCIIIKVSTKLASDSKAKKYNKMQSRDNDLIIEVVLKQQDQVVQS